MMLTLTVKVHANYGWTNLCTNKAQGTEKSWNIRKESDRISYNIVAVQERKKNLVFFSNVSFFFPFLLFFFFNSIFFPGSCKWDVFPKNVNICSELSNVIWSQGSFKLECVCKTPPPHSQEIWCLLTFLEGFWSQMLKTVRIHHEHQLLFSIHYSGYRTTRVRLIGVFG